jgi:hypothetical protein
MTLNTYSHLWPTAEDRTRQAAESMLLEALGVENPADSMRTSGTRRSTWPNAARQLLKRNSTTSPSCMT